MRSAILFHFFIKCTSFCFGSTFKLDGIGINILPQTRYEKNYYDSYLHMLSYSGGIAISFSNVRALGFTSGIQFTNFREKSGMKDYGDWRRWYPVTSTPDSTIVKHGGGTDFHLVDIPFILNFKFTRNHCLSFNLGFYLSYFINERVTYTALHTNSEIVTVTKSVRPLRYSRLQFSPTLSLAFEKNIGNSFKIKAEPMVRYQILKWKGEHSSNHSWMYGLNVTICKHL